MDVIGKIEDIKKEEGFALFAKSTKNFVKKYFLLS